MYWRVAFLRTSTRSILGMVLAIVATSIVVSACTLPSTVAPTSVPTGTAYDVLPEPGRTIEASPRHDGQGRSLVGYRIAVVVPQDASPDMLTAVQLFAREGGAHLVEFAAPTPDEDGVDAALTSALDSDADLVIGLGDGVVDVFSLLTAQWLDQQFLIVGAQLAEPTENVTAVIWPGATSRGSAASSDGDLDASTTTSARVQDALAVGVDSVRSGVTGVVLALGPQPVFVVD